MKKTALLFFPAFDWAISPTHPEREERLLYTKDQIFEEGIMDLPQITEYQPRLAQLKDIARVHFCVPDIESHLTQAHLVSAGGALTIADAVMQKEAANGFAIIRPPGHHAMTVSHGNRGFCNINNEAIMVEYMRQKYGLRRIVIVDTDVHHGDGTQDIYYHDPDVLFISFHQDGRTLFPGSGFMDEMGGPLAHGTTINIPLYPGTTDQGMHYILDHLILPIIEDFKPDLVVNSAGQDNHFTDPLANMNFTARGYADLNKKLAPDIAVLEGGYSIDTALPYINMALIMAMADIDYSNLREPGDNVPEFKEGKSNMETLELMVRTQLDTYFNREEKIAQFRRERSGFYQQFKQVFYDTEYIHEEQNSRLRICNDCCSYQIIESSARHPNGKHYRVLCFGIPIQACPQCQEEAREGYSKVINDPAGYNYVYLQDRVEDLFRSFDCAARQEKVL